MNLLRHRSSGAEGALYRLPQRTSVRARTASHTCRSKSRARCEGTVSLWDMLLLISASTALGASIGAAKIAGGGAPRYALALVAGFFVGTGSIWLMVVVSRWVDAARESDCTFNRRIRVAFLAAFAMPVIAGIVSGGLALSAIHLVVPPLPQPSDDHRVPAGV
jgi:hypothetical protein